VEFFGGYVAVELTKAWLGVRQGTGDAFAVPIAAGLSIGRIGCFLGGCCYGIPTTLPWGVAFKTAPDAGECMRHPVQLYETLFHSAALIALVMLEHRRWVAGQRLKLYLIGYLIYRFITEWIRPEPKVLYGFTAYQIACVFLAILLIGQLRSTGNSDSHSRS
jgi:phosphatidylglycerol:prolipoprotein diacylglycerol transferase